MELHLERPRMEEYDVRETRFDSILGGSSRLNGTVGSAMELSTDVFWIPVAPDMERRRSSLCHKDSWSPKGKIVVRDEKDLEKQRQLQKKIKDLTAQIVHLDKSVAVLKEENELFKKKGDELKVSEDKIKHLKRRNTELVTIARKLEDKLKHLQQDSLKKTKDITSSNTDMTVVGKSKSVVKEQRSVNTKMDEDKDRIIECLKQKCQELARVVGVHAQQQHTMVQNADIYSDTGQMEQIMRQAAKERLHLEKRLAESECVDPRIEAKLAQIHDLTELNADLENQISLMSEELHDKEQLEIEVVQRRIEVEVLNKELTSTQQLCTNLEKELEEILSKNTELSVANSGLQQQIDQLEKISLEYALMETKLKESESEALDAKNEVQRLEGVVETLTAELQCMNRVMDQKKQVEAEKQQALEQLRSKQLECESLIQTKEAAGAQHKVSVNKLEGRMSELEQQCMDLKNEKMQMALEIERIKQLYEQKLINKQSNVSPVHAAISDLQSNHNVNNSVVRSSTSVPSNASSLSDLMLPAVPIVNGLGNSDRIQKMSDVVLRTINGDISQLSSEYSDDEGGCTAASCASVSPQPLSAIRVFVVLYDYDPDQSSPNDQPDMELPLKTGEYVFVTGEMDEDGFYEGDLVDGRHGLVPSNFVSQLGDDEAAELYSMMALHMDCGVMGQRENILDGSIIQSTVDTGCDAADICTVNGLADNKINGTGSSSVDAPVNVQVKSGPDHGSLMVSWLPVTIVSSGMSNGICVAGYNVYVNGAKVKTLLNPTGDSVLLEFEDLCSLDMPRSVTVRTTTASGEESEDSLPAHLSVQLLSDILSEMQTIRSSADLGIALNSSDTKPQNKLSPKLESSRKRRPPEIESSYTDSVSSSPLLTSQASVKSCPSHRVSGVLNMNRCASEPAVGKLTAVKSDSTCANSAMAVIRVSGVEEHQAISNANTNTGGIVDLNESVPNVDNVDSEVVREKDQIDHETQCKENKDSRVLNDSVASLTDAPFQQTVQFPTFRPDVGHSTLTLGGSVWRKVQPRNSAGSSNDCCCPELCGRLPSANDFDSAQSKMSLAAQSGTSAFKAVGGFDKLRPEIRVVHNVADSRRSGSEPAESGVIGNGFGSSHCGSEDIPGDVKYATAPANFRAERRLWMEQHSNTSPTSPVGHNESPYNGQETEVDGDDYESRATDDYSFELINNNVITSRQLRDIPDSELVDYSDDGGESLVDSSVTCGVVDETVRIFVGLFDYDPATMSPNPDAAETELPFAEGQIIKIFGEQDADGFYVGECNGRKGLVPSNMVSLVEVDDPDMAIQLLQDSCQQVLADGSVSSSRASSRTSGVTTRTTSTISRHGDKAPDERIPISVVEPVRYMVALYSYDPQELSPNDDADQELPFKRGDIIAIYGEIDDDGFYFGEVHGRCGLVPSNFLEPAPVNFSAS